MYNKNLLHYVVVTGILVRVSQAHSDLSNLSQTKEAKYLITKRADWEKAYPGRWTVPGGKLEVLDYVFRKKDTPTQWYNVMEDLLKREIMEEVGLEIKDIGYVTSLVYMRSDEVPCLIISLYAEPKTEEVKLCNALTEFAWVSLEEAKNYDLIEGIYEELEILDKKLETGDIEAWKINKNL
ncbi:MAG: NUDIX domain-containing protein [archaeon]